MKKTVFYAVAVTCAVSGAMLLAQGNSGHGELANGHEPPMLGVHCAQGQGGTEKESLLECLAAGNGVRRDIHGLSFTHHNAMSRGNLRGLCYRGSNVT